MGVEGAGAAAVEAACRLAGIVLRICRFRAVHGENEILIRTEEEHHQMGTGLSVILETTEGTNGAEEDRMDNNDASWELRYRRSRG